MRVWTASGEREDLAAAVTNHSHSTTLRGSGGKYKPPAQQTSFWVGLEREQFTAKARVHFESMMPPQTLGITLQVAQKNGVVY